MPRFFLMTMIVFFSHMAVTAHSAGSVVGTWYQDGQPGDPTLAAIVIISPNGSYKSRFRSCERGREGVHVGTGRWRMSGNQFEVFTDAIDGERRDWWDKFEIVFNDSQKLQKKWIAANDTGQQLGSIFNLTKVAENFPLPGCNLTS